MDVLAPVRAFDRVQRRHRALALPVAVLKKFSDDQAGNLAAVMAYYAFFSLFPLLLVFTTVLGFVLADNPQAQKDILDSTLDADPARRRGAQGRDAEGQRRGPRRRPRGHAARRASA